MWLATFKCVWIILHRFESSDWIHKASSVFTIFFFTYVKKFPTFSRNQYISINIYIFAKYYILYPLITDSIIRTDALSILKMRCWDIKILTLSQQFYCQIFPYKTVLQLEKYHSFKSPRKINRKKKEISPPCLNGLFLISLPWPSQPRPREFSKFWRM